MEKRAILKVNAVVPILHPQTGQPVGHREMESLQVFDLDMTLGDVLNYASSKGTHVVQIAFETEVFDRGAIQNPPRGPRGIVQ